MTFFFFFFFQISISLSTVKSISLFPVTSGPSSYALVTLFFLHSILHPILPENPFLKCIHILKQFLLCAMTLVFYHPMYLRRLSLCPGEHICIFIFGSAVFHVILRGVFLKVVWLYLVRKISTSISLWRCRFKSINALCSSKFSGASGYLV